MSLPKYFNLLMASAVSVSIAATPVGFAPAFAQSAPAAEAPGDSGWQKEFELWRTSNKGGKVADYQKYLRLYPNGKFANVAKRRIEELNASAQTTKSDETAAVADATKNVGDGDGKRDLEMWRQVSKAGKLADYEKYLKEFPQGKFAKVAKTRIENLTASTSEDKQDTDVAAQQTDDAAPADDTQDMAQDQAQSDETPADAADKADMAQADDQPQDQGQGADWEQEYALWKAASDGNTVTEYEAYLRMYPNGKFAAIAQARIAQLAAAETPDPTISEGDQQDDAAARADRKRQKNNDQGEDQQASQEIEQEPADDRAQNQDVDETYPEEQQANANMGGLKVKQNQDAQDQQQVEFTEGSADTEDAILDRETRLELQGRLSSLGYDTLGTDGVFGERSRDAIASWQQDNGAPVTGYLSEDQVQAIFTASAATYATWLASRVPVRVHRVRPRAEWVLVRPRTKVMVVKRRPAAVVVKPVRNRFKNRVKVKVRFNGGCRKKRRC